MERGESPEEATACAGAALATMARLGIKPSPPNFQIWYRHASGRYPDLSRTLEILESSGGSFTDARNAQLHELFFGTGREARRIGEVARRIEQLLCRLQDLLAEDGGVGRFGEALGSLGERLPKEDAGAEGRALVAAIVGESARVAERARRLKGQLAESARTVASLRDELAARGETSVDALTGVASRRAFELRLNEGVADSLEAGEPLSLLLVDLDRFEAFNDAHGRPLGDRVLKLMARTLSRSIEDGGLVARYGGDEFAILLPRTALAEAVGLANHLRRTVSANRVVVKSTGRDLGAITLSIGAAEYAPRELLGRLLRRAGQALQRAKREGGNRVGVADPAVAGASAGESVRRAIGPAAAPARGAPEPVQGGAGGGGRQLWATA